MDELHLTKGQKHDGYYFYSPQTDFFFVTDFAKHPRKNPWIVKLIDDILKKNDCTWREIVPIGFSDLAVERGVISGAIPPTARFY